MFAEQASENTVEMLTITFCRHRIGGAGCCAGGHSNLIIYLKIN